MSIHAVIITHTHRLLEPVLLGAATQTLTPDRIFIGVDGNDSAIRSVVQRAVNTVRKPMFLVTRPHQGEARPAQVRNNAVRALIASSGVELLDRVVVLDGDTIPANTCFEQHAKIGGERRVVLGLRHMLTQNQTKNLDTVSITNGSPPCIVTPEQENTLRQLHRRWSRRQLLRRIGATKQHKPQLVGCHFSCPLSAWVTVNGFDEHFTGHGFEDDDFGRRLYKAGFPPQVSYLDVIAWHQHHPTRATVPIKESDPFNRFQQPWTTRCEHGLENCVSQPTPTIELFEPT